MARSDLHQIEYREVPNTNPDPSVRTIEQLQREVSALKELHGVRLTAMDKAIQVAHDDLVRVPTDVQTSVSSLQDVLNQTFKIHEEKFNVHAQKFVGIETQFQERDERTQKTAELNQKAIDAALQAQKESAGAQTLSLSASIAKSEAGTTKELDAIKVLIASGIKSVEDKVNDLKSRLDRGEGNKSGRNDFWGYIVGGAAVLAVILEFALRH